MQCKDIPDKPILYYLSLQNGKWVTWWDPKFRIQCFHEAIPNKLIIAKMRMLLKRKLVDGCPCGCRGDWVITKKGLANLITQ